jgi:hypothetical protein
MSALIEPVAKKIARLFRVLASDQDGEVLASVAAMKRLFAAERLSFHDIAAVIESCNGEIEERKYSDADAEIIFNRGVEQGGRKKPARKSRSFQPTITTPMASRGGMRSPRSARRTMTGCDRRSRSLSTTWWPTPCGGRPPKSRVGGC